MATKARRPSSRAGAKLPDQRASIGFGLIVRNGEGTLEACLKSIRPYVQQIVVGIDTLSTDRTPQIARKYADKVVPVDVSEWHECEQHGRIQAQHFARARNEVFKHLDPALDFWAWIDADDVIEGAERLPALARNLPEEAIGTWHPYWYSTIQKEDGSRQVNTLFHRERILRTHYRGQPVQWEWQHRVHEVVTPLNVQGPKWIQNEDIRWVHQHQAHKSEQSAPRNLTLLEIELEDDPDCTRTVFYMGHSYFALGDFPRAAQWYEQYCERFPVGVGNPHELWQSYVYLSHVYERLGEMDAAKQAAFGAIDALPEHPEPYWRLAAIYAATGQPQKTEYWTRKADECPEAPFFAFKNPMDRDFNKWVPLAEAHLQMGHLAEAVNCWRQAVQTFPDEQLVERLRLGEAQAQAEQLANDYLQLANVLAPDQRLAVYEALPEPVKAFGRARNPAMSVLRGQRSSGRASSQPKIIFWCGKSLEPWAPPTLDATGIGGSETAVIKIAERFARAGWQVDVYNSPDYMEGVYGGVGYWDPGRLGSDNVCDVFVSWRQPGAHSVDVKARQKVLWCHDLNYGPGVAGDMLHWPIVLGVSQWHAVMLAQYYGLFNVTPFRGDEWGDSGLELKRTWFVPNGIDLERFPADVKKVPFRCVYASSPDRGLGKVLELWPRILRAEPEAELHLAYGWENIDRMIAGGRTDLVAFREQMTAMIEKTERVVWRGRLPQKDVAQLYAESYLWLYPADFLEVSCISAMEAMAGGAVPIVTRAGALPETIGDAGLLVPGPPQSRAFTDVFPKVASGVMMDAGMRAEYVRRGHERAKGFTWDAAFERWLDVLGVADGTQGSEATLSETQAAIPEPSALSPEVSLPEMVAA